MNQNEMSDSKMNDQNLLQVEHLKLYFGKEQFRAVDDVSFDIKKGEVFGLVGESGCGKTSTGRSVIRLHKITGGRIFYKGKLIASGELDNINAIKAAKAEYKQGAVSKEEYLDMVVRNKKAVSESRALSRKNKFETSIQMIFQDPVSSLDPRMTVREIIAEGLRIKGTSNETQIALRVKEALVKVGLLPEYADRYPHEFSGGQRQRIGIARAIVMNPELIIADEPVSALDVSVKAQIINLLNDLRKDMGLSVLFIAHDLSVVKYFSDRIAVMYAGKIVEMADADELFANPLHPYTISLLSAIPLPDPHYEKKRNRIIYNPETAHNYSKEKPVMRNLTPTHSVLCSTKELEAYRKKLGLQSSAGVNLL